MDNRPAHLDYARSLGAKLLLAGPMLNQDGDPAGSLLIVEAENEDEVREIAAGDPYAKAGLFAQVEITPFKTVISNFPAE